MSANIRRSMLTESDDSTEDLILKEETPVSASGMLSTEPYLNYVVEVPETNKGKSCSCLVKFLLCIIFIVAIICVVFIALYYHEKDKKDLSNDNVCLSPSCIEAAAFIQSSLDETIDPCDDFYLYSCGGWLANNPIPDGRSRWGIDSALGEKNNIIMKNILQNVTIKETDLKSKAEFKSFQLYKSCMDMKAIEKLGAKPLKKMLSTLGDFSDASDSLMADVSNKKLLQSFLLNLFKNTKLTSFYGYGIYADDKDSKKHIMKFSQSGLGLNEYQYNNNDTSKVVTAYINYMVALGEKLYDDSQIKKETLLKYAKETYHFEKQLKEIFVPQDLRSTADQTYHVSSLENLTKLVPNVEWLELVNSAFDEVKLSVHKDEAIILTTLSYFEKLSDLLNKTPMRVIHNHGVFHTAFAFSPFLTDDFQEIKKNLSIASTGVFKIFPRWKRCVSSTDSGLGMALGSLFVKKAFVKSSHDEANNMVQQLRASYIESFQHLDWMDSQTQQAAADKAKAIYQKIGYPTFILDSKKLDHYYKDMFDLKEDDYFQNEMNILTYETSKELRKLRQSVDKTEWYMTPPTINAYYDPSSNQIVFPAGILQPPYFKFDYPKAVNYGSMGAVIGHEITHGFDNNGRLYDKDGNYHGKKSWWTQSSLDGFNKRKECFVKQYSQFTEADRHLHGNVTLGENIADNGGLKAAYRAYKDWTLKNGEEKMLPGLSKTNDQIFFISFGQSWCTDELKDRLIKQIETDVHSPAIDRVRGSVENNKDFSRAFNCPINSNMNPKNKCSIW